MEASDRYDMKMKMLLIAEEEDNCMLKGAYNGIEVLSLIRARMQQTLAPTEIR